MELLDVPVTLPSTKDKATIHIFSDIHRAAAGCDSKKLRCDINKFRFAVEEKGEVHLWLGGGDWSNAIGPKDRRFDQMAVAEEFQQYVGGDLFGVEARVLADEFRPIRDYGIGIGMGNHEDKIAAQGEFNPSVDIAERLNLPFLGYNAIIRFRVTIKGKSHSSTCVMYWHHGRGAARTAASKLKMLQDMTSVIDADVYVVGHTHEIVDAPGVVLSVSRRGFLRLIAREQLFLNSGTYLKTYNERKRPQKSGQYNEGAVAATDYGEKAAYKPTVIGHNGFTMQIRHTGNGQQKRSEWKLRLEKVAL